MKAGGQLTTGIANDVTLLGQVRLQRGEKHSLQPEGDLKVGGHWTVGWRVGGARAEGDTPGERLRLKLIRARRDLRNKTV